MAYNNEELNEIRKMFDTKYQCKPFVLHKTLGIKKEDLEMLTQKDIGISFAKRKRNITSGTDINGVLLKKNIKILMTKFMKGIKNGIKRNN